MPKLSSFPASSSKRPYSASPLRAFVSRRYSINIIIIILLIQTIISLPLFLPCPGLAATVVHLPVVMVGCARLSFN